MLSRLPLPHAPAAVPEPPELVLLMEHLKDFWLGHNTFAGGLGQIPFCQGFFILSVMDGRMLLTLSSLSSCLTQARDKNFLLKMVVFCGDLGWSFLLKEERGISRSTPGASRNILDEVALKNVCLVARAR